MKAQILELSAVRKLSLAAFYGLDLTAPLPPLPPHQDSRNVLRNPPPGVQFHFDFAMSHPVAMATLQEDSRLQKLRFELVPKK